MTLRAAVSLRADTTLVVPVVDVDYILMVAAPRLDASGRFRIIFESVTLADGNQFVLAKNKVDSVLLTDDEFLSVDKSLVDTATMLDEISALLLFIRNFSDGTSVSDENSWVFTPAVKQDAVAVTEVVAKSHSKLVQDGFAMNDGSEAVDGSVYSIAKGISNVAFVGDDNNLIFAASRVESVVVSDAGALLAQGYCDLSYFAEDYVGEARNF